MQHWKHKVLCPKTITTLSFPRRRESSPVTALEERQIEQYLLQYLCHPYGISKGWIPASAGTTVLWRQMNLDETTVFMKTGVPISRSARSNQEIATRAPVCAAYQTGESPVQTQV